MRAAVRGAVGSDPEPPPPPRLGPALVEPPHPAIPPRSTAAVPRRRTGWAYATVWALAIGLGAVAAGAFVGYLVNGPPGHTPHHRIVADVTPPTPDVPPPTAQEIVGARSASATTPSPSADTPARAPAAPASSATTTAARTALPPIPPAKPSIPPAKPSTPAAQPSPPAPPLSSGDIREVQGRLRSLGFDPGPLDGDAGPRTAAALTRYQEAHGLQPTGVADSDVLAELRREPGSTAPPPPPPPRPRVQSYRSAYAPPPRQSNPFLDALNQLFGR